MQHTLILGHKCIDTLYLHIQLDLDNLIQYLRDGSICEKKDFHLTSK